MSNRTLFLKSAGFDGFSFEERDVPEPAPGEALLRVRASCLNYHDWVILKGIAPVAYPRIPLSDAVAEVVSVGAGVTRVAPGDRVCPSFFQGWLAGPPLRDHWRTILGDTIDGVARDFLCLPAETLSHVPEHLTDLQAGTLPCAGLTAWAALERAGARAGETVLVQGTGGVSIFALQLAKARGCRVIATSSSDEKLERAHALGADATINYRATPEWSRAALEVTDGIGVDVTVDVGGQETVGQSIACARTGGRISLVGLLSGYGDAAFNPAAAFTRQISLFGIAVDSRSELDALCRAISASRIEPVVSDVFPLEEIAAACDLMEAGGHFGKIALEVA